MTTWITYWLTDTIQRVVLNGQPSDWLSVTSEVPLWSMLGHILFIVYISDLESRWKSTLSKFGDDTKVDGKTLMKTNCEIIEKDLNPIIEGLKIFIRPLMVANGVMHIGSRNSNHSYIRNGSPRQAMQEEKDIDVIISSDL